MEKAPKTFTFHVFMKRNQAHKQYFGKWLNAIWIVLISQLVGLGLTSCQTPATERFNLPKCTTIGPDSAAFIRFEVEGNEENLIPFFEALDIQLGPPEITFLHYTLEHYADFFSPQNREIRREILHSPYGIQKILIWDDVYRPEWSADSLQISLQVEEKRDGSRPIDLHYVQVEFRVRTYNEENILENCPDSNRFTKWVNGLVVKHIGNPHAQIIPEGWEELEARYEAAKARFATRAAPYFAGDCYPPVSHLPGSNTFKIQVCEHESVTDTLNCRVAVYDENAQPLPFTLINLLSGRYTDTLKILDGISGYSLHCATPDEIARIVITPPNGDAFDLYTVDDFFRNPLPYKPRTKPEDFKPTVPKPIEDKLKEV